MAGSARLVGAMLARAVALLSAALKSIFATPIMMQSEAIDENRNIAKRFADVETSRERKGRLRSAGAAPSAAAPKPRGELDKIAIIV